MISLLKSSDDFRSLLPATTPIESVGDYGIGSLPTLGCSVCLSFYS